MVVLTGAEELGARRGGVVARAAANAAGLVAADAAALSLAAGLTFAAARWLSESVVGAPFVALAEAVWDRLPLMIAAGLLAGFRLQARRHYSGRVPFWAEVGDLAGCALAAVVVEGFLQYAAKVHVSRLWIAGTWLLWPVLAMALRAGAKDALLRLGWRTVRTVVIGPVAAAREAAGALGSERRLGYEVSARIDGTVAPAEAARLARAAGAEFVVVAVDGAEGMGAAMRALAAEGIAAAAMPRLRGMALLGMEARCFLGHDVALLVERDNLARPVARAVKRAVDVVGAAILLILLFPVLGGIAWLVRRDGGPALFAHERIGMAGRPFACLKFRSMTVDAEGTLERVLATDAAMRAEWARDRKLRSDPRVSRLGAVLRRTALDELPQLINVLRGEMSLVGPRPIVAAEMVRYGEEIDAYLRVRPGMTGLWQVSGRSDLNYERRVELDGWYVRNWSFWIDMAVLLMTVPAVLRRRGAY